MTIDFNSENLSNNFLFYFISMKKSLKRTTVFRRQFDHEDSLVLSSETMDSYSLIERQIKSSKACPNMASINEDPPKDWDEKFDNKFDDDRDRNPEDGEEEKKFRASCLKILSLCE